MALNGAFSNMKNWLLKFFWKKFEKSVDKGIKFMYNKNRSAQRNKKVHWKVNNKIL